MALEDLTPVTRTEAILDGDDISPVTRMEYFLQKAASGSSLPPYTSADKDKVLTLGDGSGSETVTIVPEQTISIENLGEDIILENSDLSHFTEGRTVTIGFDGVYAETTIIDDDGLGAESDIGDYHCMIFDNGNNELQFSSVPSITPGTTHAVSLTYSVPSVEPKWESAFMPIKVVAVQERGQNYTDFAVDKSVKEVRACFNVDTYKPVFALLPVATPTPIGFDYSDMTSAVIGTMPNNNMQLLPNGWSIYVGENDGTNVIILRYVSGN